MAMCALMATATLTSCEGALDDIFGEWSRPVQKKECPISFSISSKLWGSKDSKFTVEVTKNGDYTVTFSSSDPSIATVDPTTGEVTPVGAGTVDIIAKIVVDNEGIFESTTAKYTLTIEEGNHYLKWNETTKQMEIAFIDATAMPSTTGDHALAAGTYIVSEDITTGNVTLSGDVNIILCDGKKLTMNALQCATSPTNLHKLNIYGQSENSGKLIVSGAIYNPSPLNVYGGQIDVTTPGKFVINNAFGMNVYGGKITATVHNDGDACALKLMGSGNKLAIYGGEMIVDAQHTGGTASYCDGIQGDVEAYGGKLTVTSVKTSYCNAYAINGNLTVNGGTVSLYGGPSAGNDMAVKSGDGTITAGAGVLEESDDETSWTTITGTSSTKHYIRTKQ